MNNRIHAGEMPATIALFIDPGTATGEYVQATDSEMRSAWCVYLLSSTNDLRDALRWLWRGYYVGRIDGK